MRRKGSFNSAEDFRLTEWANSPRGECVPAMICMHEIDAAKRVFESFQGLCKKKLKIQGKLAKTFLCAEVDSPRPQAFHHRNRVSRSLFLSGCTLKKEFTELLGNFSHFFKEL